MTGAGWATHESGVRLLQKSYARIPDGAPVRLSKPTSNLFRKRAESATPGLDVSGLTGVVEIDPAGRVADVQGMCTYENLVAVTLPHGLIPLVVPQLRTITVGGAVTGLGVESTSFRNGLPHESVLEMDVFTGAGEVVTVKPGDPLFDAFPNSYGSLGYATRLRIELEPVRKYVELRHVRFDDLDRLAAVVEEVTGSRRWEEQPVDAIDGVAFSPDEAYLTLAAWSDGPAARAGSGSDGQVPTSDYTGQDIYFESLRTRERDLLTTADYLWRWDTDWFWCSGAFGLHDPRVRRLWPRRWRRSDVYHRLVGLDQRFRVSARLDARKGIRRERVIQDVEVTTSRLPEFLRWFDAEVGMRPVWLCPLRLREPEGAGSGRAWPGYPLTVGTTYVNVGFWGTRPIAPGREDGDLNRAVERKVSELGGHKSLYSDVYYDPETFAGLYNTDNLNQVRRRFDPQGRLTGLYEKAVKGR